MSYCEEDCDNSAICKLNKEQKFLVPFHSFVTQALPRYSFDLKVVSVFKFRQCKIFTYYQASFFIFNNLIYEGPY